MGWEIFPWASAQNTQLMRSSNVMNSNGLVKEITERSVKFVKFTQNATQPFSLSLAPVQFENLPKTETQNQNTFPPQLTKIDGISRANLRPPVHLRPKIKQNLTYLQAIEQGNFSFYCFRAMVVSHRASRLRENTSLGLKSLFSVWFLDW